MYSYCRKRKIIKHSNETRRSGFVLVMTLMLIGVVGLSLAGLARKSLQLAQQAAAAKQDLQLRWGAYSCREVWLARAEELLDAEAEKSTSAPASVPAPSTIEQEFQLGELQFVIRLSDEQAKVNLNELRRLNSNELTPTINRLIESENNNTLRVRYIPSLTTSELEDSQLTSWGQVFERLSGESEWQVARATLDLTQQMTCWGSGKLNFLRASDEAVRTLCATELSDETIERLLVARQESTGKGAGELARQLGLSLREQIVLRRLMTDESQCYALWMLVQDERRGWASLTIDGASQTGDQGWQTFRW